MAEREECGDDANEEDICSTQRDVEELKRKLRPPDKARFERELEKINVSIREHEAKFRSFQSSRSQGVSSISPEGKDRETLMTELRGHKAEREKEIDTRKKIDQELKGLNSLVQQKNDACAKVQAGLKYKSEAKADEAIRRLEHQMRVQQLKLREEKRLVSEIDTLRRSKKLIHEFDALKQVIGQLRDKQNALRKQRDNCMRTIARLKSKEEEIKSSLDEQRSKDVEAKQQQRGYNSERNALKKEIDDLYTKKRALVTVYNKEKDEYSALLKDIREQERHIKREVEAMKRIEKRHSHRQRHGSESAEVLIRDAVHEKMLNNCDSLIKYLESLNINAKTSDVQSVQEQKSDVKGADSSFTGGMFLKKKMDDDLEEMYAGSAYRKSSKRGSRKGRKSTQKENVPKKLVLHPVVLDQFLSLTITPPCTAAEVPKVLELLIEKKANLNTAIDLPDPVPRSPSPTSSSASSLENFPSLPSQQQSLASLDELEDEAKSENDVVEVQNEVDSTEMTVKEKKNESDIAGEMKNESSSPGETRNESSAPEEIKNENKATEEMQNGSNSLEEMKNESSAPGETRNENSAPGEMKNENKATEEMKSENSSPGEMKNENKATEEMKNENSSPGDIENENKATEEMKNESNSPGEMRNESMVQDFQEVNHGEEGESNFGKSEQINNHENHNHEELKDDNTEGNKVSTGVIKENQNNSNEQNNSPKEKPNISQNSKQNGSLYDDVEGANIICSAEEKPSNNSLTDDHVSVISTDNLANASKANSSIKCPS